MDSPEEPGVTLFTDGRGVLRKHTRSYGGYAWLCVRTTPRAPAELTPGIGCAGRHLAGTNIQMEGKAILCALRAAGDSPRVTIGTDSEFWINMATSFMPRWVSRGELTQHKNPELCAAMWKEFQRVPQRTIRLVHVRAHQKKNTTEDERARRFNELVDQLAGEAPGVNAAATMVNLASVYPELFTGGSAVGGTVASA